MNNKNAVAATLAITAMLGFLVMFSVLGFAPVPPENKDFFNMGFIALIGFVGTAFGYYLGSSLGSAQKNELLTQGLSPDKDPLGPKGSGEGLSTAGYVRLPLLFLLLAFACLIALTGGCATTGQSTAHVDSPLQTAGKSLLAVKSGIVTAATATASLCQLGTIGAEKCTQAKNAYAAAKPAYDLALESYLLMSTGGGDPADFGPALLRVQNLAASLLLITGGAQ
ncbi:MAG: hypothetical protein WA003_01905 [Desulfuromonadaceae bacterium]